MIYFVQFQAHSKAGLSHGYILKSKTQRLLLKQEGGTKQEAQETLEGVLYQSGIFAQKQ